MGTDIDRLAWGCGAPEVVLFMPLVGWSVRPERSVGGVSEVSGVGSSRKPDLTDRPTPPTV